MFLREAVYAFEFDYYGVLDDDVGVVFADALAFVDDRDGASACALNASEFEFT